MDSQNDMGRRPVFVMNCMASDHIVMDSFAEDS